MILLLLFTAIESKPLAQVYYTKNGNISFFSKTMMENIDAENNQVLSVLDIQTGSIQFSLLNNAFHFPKAKMEDDFNENYIESNKYPRSTFKGTIMDIQKINFASDGIYKVNVTGDLTVHGITKNISAPGTITIKNGMVSASSSFNILLKDYKIDVPSIVFNKIAESIKVNIDCHYQKK